MYPNQMMPAMPGMMPQPPMMAPPPMMGAQPMMQQQVIMQPTMMTMPQVTMAPTAIIVQPTSTPQLMSCNQIVFACMPPRFNCCQGCIGCCTAFSSGGALAGGACWCCYGCERQDCCAVWCAGCWMPCLACVIYGIVAGCIVGCKMMQCC